MERDTPTYVAVDRMLGIGCSQGGTLTRVAEVEKKNSRCRHTCSTCLWCVLGVCGDGVCGDGMGSVGAPFRIRLHIRKRRGAGTPIGLPLWDHPQDGEGGLLGKGGARKAMGVTSR